MTDLMLPDESGQNQGSAEIPPLDMDAAKRTFDDLFANAKLYQNSGDYKELLDFIGKFRFYAPFNAMLVFVQRPGARYVATANRWMLDYRRKIKPGALPIMILQPNGPVLFVFDVADTEGGELPKEVANPFEVTLGNGVDTARVSKSLDELTNNAKRDGVAVRDTTYGSQQAGQIQLTDSPYRQIEIRRGPNRRSVIRVPERYVLILNRSATNESRLATLVHELGHLYCGHLGSLNERWWPSRMKLDRSVREFEAESVAYAVCTRLGFATRSAEYLSGYVRDHETVPSISLDAVLKAIHLVERMATMPLPLRRKPEGVGHGDETPPVPTRFHWQPGPNRYLRITSSLTPEKITEILTA